MVVLLGFYKRKAGLTHDQFSHLWFTRHAPLIKTIPGIEKYLVRYVQHHLSPDSQYPTPDGIAFDGFSEVWFTSVEARDELFSSPFFLKDVIDDESKFIDMDATRWIVMDEQKVIIPGPGA